MCPRRVRGESEITMNTYSCFYGSELTEHVAIAFKRALAPLEILQIDKLSLFKDQMILDLTP